jgi:hypothetical protein
MKRGGLLVVDLLLRLAFALLSFALRSVIFAPLYIFAWQVLLSGMIAEMACWCLVLLS